MKRTRLSDPGVTERTIREFFESKKKMKETIKKQKVGTNRIILPEIDNILIQDVFNTLASS